MPEIMALAGVIALQHPAATQKTPQRIPPRAMEGGLDVGVWRMRHNALVGCKSVEAPSTVVVGQRVQWHAPLQDLCDQAIQVPGGQPGLCQGVLIRPIA